METEPLFLCDQQLNNDYHLEKSFSFGDSAEMNLKMLMELTTYFRQKVIPKYEEHSQVIRTRALLLSEKKNYFLEDLVKIKILKNNLLSRSNGINKKCELVRTKQTELLRRSEAVIYTIHSRKDNLSHAEKELLKNLACYIEKIDLFQKDIDAIRSKHDAVKSHDSNCKIDCDVYYLHNWQVKIIRDGLHIIGKEIKKLYDDLTATEKELNDHIDNVYLKEIEQC